MTQYRVEIKQGDTTEIVEVDCNGIESIRAVALKMARVYISELSTDFWEAPLWALRVTDESNMSILSLTFSGD